VIPDEIACNTINNHVPSLKINVSPSRVDGIPMTLLDEFPSGCALERVRMRERERESNRAESISE